jgi:hypothetical protein
VVIWCSPFYGSGHTRAKLLIILLGRSGVCTLSLACGKLAEPSKCARVYTELAEADFPLQFRNGIQQAAVQGVKPDGVTAGTLKYYPFKLLIWDL